MDQLKEKIDTKRLPRHIAITMDGNGRWAKQRGDRRSNGHIAGVDTVRSTIEAAGELGIEFLTLYTFSTENWNRPREEVEMLLE
ncbi:MAG: undecaprenyl diphosphate synthase family protein, partial [Paramuribaculum sp.]|nr:undecaprenyl diphosphate synthase family protein [Paramuribaculum sp.]